jgi:hypothetical protein
MADLTGEKKGITMSQYPPPPPQPPQYPPQGMPPQGFPPQGYPQQPYGGAPQAAKSNGMAITSLIMGILSCIPGVGLLAILFGLLGMGKAKDPRVGGKGLAVVGLLLGVLGTVGWAYGAYKINQGWHLLKGMAEPAAGFFQGVADGDFSKAKSYTTNNVSEAEIRAAQETMKSMGKYKNMQADPQKTTWENGVLESSGVVIFENGTKKYHFRMVKVGDSYKVDKFTLE